MRVLPTGSASFIADRFERALGMLMGEAAERLVADALHDNVGAGEIDHRDRMTPGGRRHGGIGPLAGAWSPALRDIIRTPKKAKAMVTSGLNQQKMANGA